MGLIVIVAVVTLGPVIGYSLLVWRRLAAGKPAVAAGDLLAIMVVGVLLGCVVNSVFVQAALTFAVVGIGVLTKLRPRWVLAGCWIAALLPVVMATLVASHLSARVHELRQKNAFVSLAPRLAYEEDGVSATAAVVPLDADSVHPALSEKARKRLAEREKKNINPLRTDALQRLHSEYADHFALAAGFGVGRMAGIRSYAIEAPESERTVIPMPVDGPKSAQLEEMEPELPEASDPTFPAIPALDVLSLTGESDFLNPERFGYVRNGRVAGFIPHRFSSELSFPDRDAETTTRWQVARISLVSLLRFSEPAVYLSDELPNMERLASVPTRPLNDFERAALAKLRTDEDLVVRYSASTIRMLGSLRAGKNCLECHSVERGELLGAFSYELRRTTPAPAPAKTPPKTRPEV